MKKTFAIFLMLTFFLSFSQESKSAFWQEIQDFKQKDKATSPPKNAILLIGSSSFTKWQNVADYFPGKTFINRGFGGSSLTDLNLYADDLLLPYRPKQIIIYCGENDFAADENIKADVVVDRFKSFYGKIRQRFPNVEVDFISIKYSPSRKHLWPQMKEANKKINNMMTEEKNAEFIDITGIMMDKNGMVRKDLFVDDLLHMTPEGYKLWAKVMLPYLK